MKNINEIMESVNNYFANGMLLSLSACGIDTHNEDGRTAAIIIANLKKVIKQNQSLRQFYDDVVYNPEWKKLDDDYIVNHIKYLSTGVYQEFLGDGTFFNEYRYSSLKPYDALVAYLKDRLIEEITNEHPFGKIQ